MIISTIQEYHKIVICFNMTAKYPLHFENSIHLIIIYHYHHHHYHYQNPYYI